MMADADLKVDSVSVNSCGQRIRVALLSSSNLDLSADGKMLIGPLVNLERQTKRPRA
jgi:hypothetical protein